MAGAVCYAAIHLCRIRVTRLNEDGSPAAGPNNVYVSANPVTLEVNPQIETGEDKTLVSGCDCISAEYRGYDKLKYFTLGLNMATLEPALAEILTGAQAIVEGGKVAGVWYPSQVTCATPRQPNVAFEAWQDAWDGDHQAPAPLQYIRYLWPASRWQIGDGTLENDFKQPRLNAFTRSNPNWGLGIYGDQPEACPAGAPGGWWFTNTIPTAVCDYQTEGLT